MSSVKFLEPVLKQELLGDCEKHRKIAFKVWMNEVLGFMSIQGDVDDKESLKEGNVLNRIFVRIFVQI